MLIFWQSNLVFLATPKAGSTAIEAALEPLSNFAVQRPPELKHTNFKSYTQFVEPWLGSVTQRPFTTVAVMREPVEWLRSWYRFRVQADREDPDHDIPTISFTEFAHDYMGPDRRLLDRIGSQSDFLTHGDRTVDHVFRYEEMEDFTEFMEEWLDCVLHLPRVNVPASADVELDAETEQRLRNFMADDAHLYDRWRQFERERTGS